MNGNYSSRDMDRYFNDPEYRKNFSKAKNKKVRTERWYERYRKVLVIAGILVGGGGIIFLIHLFSGLPSLEQLENPRPELSTRVYSIDGEVLGRYFIINRSRVTLDEVPEHLITMIIAMEDRKFYDHWGIDLDRFVKQMYFNITGLRRRGGASTITQQVARNLYLSQEFSIVRKLREALTAIQIERTYTKDEILEMYLNIAFFGRGTFGIASAAQTYFGKIPADLTLSESGTLIGLLPGPALYDPFNHPERAKNRRNLVLTTTYRLGLLPDEEYEQARNEEFYLRERDLYAVTGIAPHFVEHIRRQLSRLAEQYGFDIYRDGLNVYTTLDSRMQRHANRAIEEHLEQYQQTFNRRWNWNTRRAREILQIALDRHIRDHDEYRRATTPAARDSIRYVLLQDTTFVNDVKQLTQKIETGFVAIDPKSGHILSMVGSSDFRTTRYGLNRSVQIRRQSGSAFKPFVYTVAIDNGYAPSYELLNQPVVLQLADNTQWRPTNSDGSFGGRNTMREGLQRSINLIAVRAIMEIAPVSQVIQYAQRMGIHSHIPPYPSIALGTSELSPLEITSAYGVFANEGIYVEPISILRIEDKDGNLIADFTPDRREVLSRETAYIMTDMLRDVIDGGTGMGVRNFFHYPAAGKTGTTQDFADAWFIGYTPHITAGAWVGFDDHRVTFHDWGDGQGSRAAMPIWARFMKYVYEDRTIGMPVEYFEKPEDVVEFIICNDTKMIATEFCPSRRSEIFNRTTVPETCDLHTSLRRDDDQRRRGATSY
jgi:penicillin-binding protein 1A